MRETTWQQDAAKVLNRLAELESEPPVRSSDLVGLRLEFWNGAGWECGHPEHLNMTEAEWRELKPKIRHWSCPWRVVASRVECMSRKQPNAEVSDGCRRQ